jgi:hypothetical protein
VKMQQISNMANGEMTSPHSLVWSQVLVGLESAKGNVLDRDLGSALSPERSDGGGKGHDGVEKLDVGVENSLRRLSFPFSLFYEKLFSDKAGRAA